MPPKNLNKILLVEGIADKGLFEQICIFLNLEKDIIFLPKDLAAYRNTKEGIFHTLPHVLQQSGGDKDLKLAVIIDADYIIHGKGYLKALERFKQEVEKYGYYLKNDDNEIGLIFENEEGFSDLGLWIMPNNQDEGMLEDWIKSCISEKERVFFQQASDAVKNLPKQRFGEHSHTKAEIATWLAWQKKPGEGLYITMKKNKEGERLLDIQHPLFQSLTRWLEHIFK